MAMAMYIGDVTNNRLRKVASLTATTAVAAAPGLPGPDSYQPFYQGLLF
jgi:hypothetical protein